MNENIYPTLLPGKPDYSFIFILLVFPSHPCLTKTILSLSSCFRESSMYPGLHNQEQMATL